LKTKRDIIVQPGATPSSELLAVLNSTYGSQEVEQAIAQGAKVHVSIVTPWPKPKKPKAEPVIEPALLDELHRLIINAEALETKIAELNGPQILKIGEMLGIPMSKNAKTEALRARLFGSLRSEAVWRGISGQGLAPADAAFSRSEDDPSSPQKAEDT
jgi:hypothetical protein